VAPPGRRGRVVTTATARTHALAAIAARVPRPGRPVLVVVDGADGAGKTVLADELAPLVPGAVRASLDDFHHPRAYRHAEGRTGETVWERSFDLAAVRRELLDPWQRGASSPYRRRWHDLSTDHVVDDPLREVPEDGVLVVDGVFAQRPELADAWDLVVWVHADDPVRVARMAARDGVPDDPGHPDQRRYLEAQAIYRTRCRPEETADVVVDNTHPDRLRVLRVSAAD
jgi:uridine kinase